MQFELAPFDLPSGYGEGVLSLEDAKEHLGVLGTDFDDLIGLLRDAAVDMVERYCGVYLAPRTGVEWTAERLCLPVELGVSPVTAVSHVTWLGHGGAAVSGDGAVFRIAERGRLLAVPGQALPSGVAGGVRITFDAGYTDANRPAALVRAVAMFTAHLFNHREAVASGTIGGEIPLGFRTLCNAYRIPVL